MPRVGAGARGKAWKLFDGTVAPLTKQQTAHLAASHHSLLLIKYKFKFINISCSFCFVLVCFGYCFLFFCFFEKYNYEYIGSANAAV